MALISPVYQVTVFAGVPATSAVAVANGGPATRMGGWPTSMSKKSCAAAIADAAVSCVPASVLTDWVSAACRLAAVAAGFAPIVNVSVGGGDAVVAVIVRSWVVPSGSVEREGDPIAGARIGREVDA